MINDDIKVIQEKSHVSESVFKSHYPEIYNRIVEWVKDLNITAWNEMKYIYRMQLKTRPTCKICGKEVKFRSVNRGYKQTCCRKCDLALKSETHKRLWKNKSAQ